MTVGKEWWQEMHLKSDGPDTSNLSEETDNNYGKYEPKQPVSEWNSKNISGIQVYSITAAPPC
jgi:hypothetical protein